MILHVHIYMLQAHAYMWIHACHQIGIFVVVLFAGFLFSKTYDLKVNIDEAVSVCLCVCLFLASDSSETMEVVIIIKLGMVAVLPQT